MTDAFDDGLRRRAWELLQPGEIELDGLIVRMEFSIPEEPEMHQATIGIGDLIAEHAGYEPEETFVYSGADDADFASNQHQGLTLDDESFVWECQQLFRDGSFDVVFYYEASADTEALLEAVRNEGYDATALRGAAESPDTAVIE